MDVALRCVEDVSGDPKRRRIFMKVLKQICKPYTQSVEAIQCVVGAENSRRRSSDVLSRSRVLAVRLLTSLLLGQEGNLHQPQAYR
jgi:hypothetical protein